MHSVGKFRPWVSSQRCSDSHKVSSILPCSAYNADTVCTCKITKTINIIIKLLQGSTQLFNTWEFLVQNWRSDKPHTILTEHFKLVHFWPVVFFALLMQQYARLLGVVDLLHELALSLLHAVVPALLQRLAHVQLGQPLRTNVVYQTTVKWIWHHDKRIVHHFLYLMFPSLFSCLGEHGCLI